MDLMTIAAAAEARPEQDSRIKVVAKFRGNQECSDKFSIAPEKLVIDKRSFEGTPIVGPDASEEDFYAAHIERMVNAFNEGMTNIAILTYGSTGSGKTSLLFGRKHQADQPGILHESLEQIFASSSETVRFEASCIEIYCENASDLLTEETSIMSSTVNSSLNCSKNTSSVGGKIKKTVRMRKSGFGIPDLTKIQIFTADEGVSIARKALQRRESRNTKANSESSRSHFIFTLIKFADGEPPCRMEFVDLAGFERPDHQTTQMNEKAKKSNGEFKEGVSINNSLFYLRNMMDNIRKNEKVLVRNSILTEILSKTLLAEKMQTCFIVCLNPGREADCVNAMEFAQKLRGVKVSESAIANRPRAQTPARPNLAKSLITSITNRAGSAFKRPGGPLKEIQSPPMKSAKKDLYTNRFAKTPGKDAFLRPGAVSKIPQSTTLRNSTMMTASRPETSRVLRSAEKRVSLSPIHATMLEGTVCDDRNETVIAANPRDENVVPEPEEQEPAYVARLEEKMDKLMEAFSQREKCACRCQNATPLAEINNTRPARKAAMNATAWFKRTLIASPMSPSVLAPDPQRTMILTPTGAHAVTRLSDDELNKKKALLCYHLNTLDPKKLRTLPTIGPKIAAAIAEFRKTKGEFSKVEDVEKVPGLNWKRFASANGIL